MLLKKLHEMIKKDDIQNQIHQMESLKGEADDDSIKSGKKNKDEEEDTDGSPEDRDCDAWVAARAVPDRSEPA